jgi:pSer/pThr/pTyr-binding forkhead associated (FHA) protein
MAVLIGMSADVKGKNFSLDDGELTIGRSADNTIPLNNPTVSGHHCKVAREGDRFMLRDLGSTNGTRVNAREVKETALRPKDLVQVGNVDFLFNSEVLSPEDIPEEGSATEVLVSEGPTAKPESFNSISPFGARQRESHGGWNIALWVIGVLAALGVAFFFYKLFTAQ